MQEGDIIQIDIPNNSINIALSEEELAARREKLVLRAPNITTGWLGRYARLVGPSHLGAVMQ